MTCYELEQLLKKNNNFANNVIEEVEKASDQEPYMDLSKIDQDYDWSEMKVISD